MRVQLAGPASAAAARCGTSSATLGGCGCSSRPLPLLELVVLGTHSKAAHTIAAAPSIGMGILVNVRIMVTYTAAQGAG